MNPWEFFETLNEVVYAVDLDTMQIAYANKRCRELVSPDGSPVVGRLCYEVLQGTGRPCITCNKTRLKEGEFDEWTVFNHYLDKRFIVKDTLMVVDGKRYRVELAVDVTQIGSKPSALLGEQSVEAFVNTTFKTALAESRPESSIYSVLAQLGQATKSDRSYIFEKMDDGTFKCTYEWIAAGITPAAETLNQVDTRQLAPWIYELAEGFPLELEHIDNIITTSPGMYTFLDSLDIVSMVESGLHSGGEFVGFIGVDNPQMRPLDQITSLLQTMGGFVVSTLKRRDLVAELERMAKTDQLTGLGNRFAMRSMRSNLDDAKSAGIVYGDLTGLKELNDTCGHDAGDKLICDAAHAMGHIFGKRVTFRIGGDEFLSVKKNVSEADFAEMVQTLSVLLEKHGVTMALGSTWQAAPLRDLNALFSEAERRMYEAKRTYYQKSGRDRRQRRRED